MDPYLPGPTVLVLLIALLLIPPHPVRAQQSSLVPKGQAEGRILPIDSIPDEVGDLSFDPSRDDPAFSVCNIHQVLQYYNTRSYYNDHKKEILAYFLNGFKEGSDRKDQDGYLTIRFIINCKGETGWFRVLELDSSYHAFHFLEKISGQLLELTKQLKGWEPAAYKDKVYDSYQYITFRIRNGKIIRFSP